MPQIARRMQVNVFLECHVPSNLSHASLVWSTFDLDQISLTHGQSSLLFNISCLTGQIKMYIWRYAHTCIRVHNTPHPPIVQPYIVVKCTYAYRVVRACLLAWSLGISCCFVCHVVSLPWLTFMLEFEYIIILMAYF